MKCGIIDVGSNTVRLSIYQWEGRQFRLLMNKKEMAGLAGYIREGALSDAGIQAAGRVLTGFQTLLENFDISQVHVFGTAALRNITNTEEVLGALKRETGLAVEVLTGAEEAAFSFQGATVGGGAPASGLLADIGGGSTELVHYENGTIRSGDSLPVGSLSLYTQYVSGLFPTKGERWDIRARVEEELERMEPSPVRCTHLTGVGGTIRAAAKLCNDLAGADRSNCQIPAGELHALYKSLKKGDQAVLRQILRTVPDRVHTILPGLVILRRVLKRYKVETVTVSPCGVREGYLLQRVMGVDGRG